MSGPNLYEYDDSTYYYDEDSNTIRSYEGGEVYDTDGSLISSGEN